MKRKKRRAGKSHLIALVTVLAALAVLGVLFGPDVIDAWRAKDVAGRTRELYHSSAAIWETLFSSAQAEEAPPCTLPPVQADFAELYAQNPHIVGWLQAGEEIDYPVVQDDNEFYLHHDFFGNSDNNGTIFLNEANSLFPRDDVLLIHGHNMKSGAMFGTLKRYEEKAYLLQYPLITFRTIYDAEDVYYVPIAIFNASMNEDDDEYFNITPILFADDEEIPEATPAPADLDETGTVRKSAAYQAYLEDLLAWSEWLSPADVNVDDSLMVLVTCSYHQDNGRLMLVCRKLRADETPEGMRALFAEGSE